MKGKYLLFAAALAVLWCGHAEGRKKRENGIFDVDRDESRCSSAESKEDVSIDYQPVPEEVLEEEQTKTETESNVDEEMIQKAEKIADEDLLRGLDSILKNNETLQDVFKAENINEIIL